MRLPALVRLTPAAELIPWAGLGVVVLGLGRSGFAAADALLRLGADVTVIDRREPAEAQDQDRAHILETLGARLRLGAGADSEPHWDGELLGGAALVLTSPGWPPSAPLLAAAEEAAVPIWSEVELAWRLTHLDSGELAPHSSGIEVAEPAPWLVVTGTNGKTTTVQMLEQILLANGELAVAAGNVGLPVVEAVLSEPSPTVLAVELSSFQLFRTHSLSAQASVVLNVAPDHIDWHGSFEAYVAAKATIHHQCQVAAMYNESEPLTRDLVAGAVVVEGCRAIGFTLGIPAISMLGVVEDVLVDRAFVADRRTSAAELATFADLPSSAPHVVADALAAAGLARAHGVSPRAVRDGLRAFRSGGHRIADIGEIPGRGAETGVGGDAGLVAGVRFVDDSKATNPHAALASLQAFGSVVWIAGGLAKGATFDDLVIRVAPRLRAVVLIGTDAELIADSLARHAPQVPVHHVVPPEDLPMGTNGESPELNMLAGDAVMARAVAQAVELAKPGDTVLMAPACASMDQFRDYAHRGAAFAAAAEALPRFVSTPGPVESAGSRM